MDSANLNIFTNLESQVIKLQDKHPTMLLAVECGYKYRFFDKDAKIVSKLLNMQCNKGPNLMTASFPSHRLIVHARRLVQAGHLVGIVRQTETVHSKSLGPSCSKVFNRKLSDIYSRATFIEENFDYFESLEYTTSTVPNYLMSICGDDVSKRFAIIVAQISTCEVIYDQCTDLADLEQILYVFEPVEICVQEGINIHLSKMLENYCQLKSTPSEGVCVRKFLGYNSKAYSEILACFQRILIAAEGNYDLQLSNLLTLPTLVQECLFHLYVHFEKFSVEKLILEALSHNTLQISSVKNSWMRLSSGAIENMELFSSLHNTEACCFLEQGGLLGFLSRQKTKMGARLMRKWISKPLVSKTSIEDRQNAVTELIKNSSVIGSFLKGLFFHLNDLERGLATILYGKCSPRSYVVTCRAFVEVQTKIHSALSCLKADCGSDAIVISRLEQLMLCLRDTDQLMSNIDEVAALSNVTLDRVFKRCDDCPFLVQLKLDEQRTMEGIEEAKVEMTTILNRRFDFVTVGGQEFLVEVDWNEAKMLSSDWISVNSTKTKVRLRWRKVHYLHNDLCAIREGIERKNTEYWKQFLTKIATKHYWQLKRAADILAELDCLLVLSELALNEGFCRPQIVEEPCLILSKAWHPVYAKSFTCCSQYVRNDCQLKGDGVRGLIITGPNMGGKSSYVRLIGISILLAQIGSFVPAEQAKLSIFDAIFIRSGLKDNIYRRESTLMQEFNETSRILREATGKSFIVFDELGQGTSTYDGYCVASSVLTHLIKNVKCLFAFITHFRDLSQLSEEYTGSVRKIFANYVIENSDDDITMLFEMEEGSIEKSFGFNVAKMAGVDSGIISAAKRKSHKLETHQENKRRRIDEFINCW